MWRPVDTYPWFNDPELMTELRNRLLKHITPLLGYADSTGDQVRVYGSAILVKGQSGCALITASHVIDGFLQLRANENGAARLMAAGGYGRAWTSVGDWDIVRPETGDADIAALRLPEHLTPSMLHMEPWVGRTSPRRPLEAGDIAYALGFPGVARIEVGPQTVFGAVGVKEFVASASERHFVMVPENGPRTFRPNFHFHRVFNPIDRVGGLSGAPVFAFVAPRVLMISDMADDLFQWMDIVPEWELAGVVYEGDGGINEAWLFVSHTRHLNL